ncbi:MAG TPA: sigma-70 family RNA polymerase sigma factor [Opitutaceae bacterium]|nr:sigma-70 family RNA polymerase sigma factor [Opitutaceae bacterium]
MQSKAMNVPMDNDADLVSASLSGDRTAFGRIVSRYQSLVCSVTYSATGNLALSEDVAQETFVTAWRQLAELREPAKLKAWLCGIARNLLHNTLRRLGREPSQAAETLDAAGELSAPEELPATQTIRREEETILWQALERVPELYREPLILFYREGRSVEQTAALLDLSEDVVRQRLTRGRKQLAEEVTAFVEGTLSRTAPGAAFAPSVLAALPPLVAPAKVAAIGAAAKGGMSAKIFGAGGVLSNLLLSPLLILLGNYTSYRMSLDAASSEAERAAIRSFYRKLLGWTAAMVIIFPAAIFWRDPLARIHSLLPLGLAMGIVVFGTGSVFATAIRAARLRSRWSAAGPGSPDVVQDLRPAYEYRSAATLLGWPLVHIRLVRRVPGRDEPVKAWFAAGDRAVGLIFAYGGFVVAPVSIGGVAIGFFSLGACALGIFTLGACTVGLWASGGVALGWQAFGGFGVAWNLAVGGVVFARDFALGNLAYAAEANNPVAHAFAVAQPFYRLMETLQPFSVVINLLWVVPLILWRWAISRQVRKDKAGAGIGA